MGVHNTNRRLYYVSYHFELVAKSVFCILRDFLDLEGGSQNATLVVLVVVVVRISSLKIRKVFLICSATKLYVHIRAHIFYRSAVLDF